MFENEEKFEKIKTDRHSNGPSSNFRTWLSSGDFNFDACALLTFLLFCSFSCWAVRTAAALDSAAVRYAVLDCVYTPPLTVRFQQRRRRGQQSLFVSRPFPCLHPDSLLHLHLPLSVFSAFVSRFNSTHSSIVRTFLARSVQNELFEASSTAIPHLQKGPIQLDDDCLWNCQE